MTIIKYNSRSIGIYVDYWRFGSSLHPLLWMTFGRSILLRHHQHRIVSVVRILIILRQHSSPEVTRICRSEEIPLMMKCDQTVQRCVSNWGKCRCNYCPWGICPWCLHSREADQMDIIEVIWKQGKKVSFRFGLTG